MEESKIDQILNRENLTTFKSAVPNRNLDIVIGDAKQTEFYPRLKLEKWDNEVNFSVGVIKDDDKPETLSLVDNKVIWQQGSREVHTYSLEDGFEYEVVLKEKPTINVIEMSIQTKGLDYFYQPFLTEQEKLEMSITRPPNVEGSYAVYHKEKTGDFSRVGGSNYSTGKAFHIYRPKIVDARGRWAWGLLEINPETELLTITVPQSILDGGTYPITVDPTFGYSTKGASSTSSDIEGAIAGSLFMIPENGTASSVSAAPTGTLDSANGTFMGIYLHSTSGLVASTGTFNSRTVGLDGGGFLHRDLLTSPSLTSGTGYVLVIGMDDTGKSDIALYFDVGATNQGHRDSTGYPIYIPDPADFAIHNTNKYSVYVTYTADSTPPTTDHSANSVFFGCNV